MNGFISKVRNKVKSVLAVFGVGCTSLVCATPAWASETSVTANDALVKGATDAVAQITANINAVIPIALGILGLVLAIQIGIKVFKRVTKSAS